MADERPKCAKHTPAPSGYLAWHEWAERKSRTHVQVRCPDCDLLHVWVPKKSRAARLAKELS